MHSTLMTGLVNERAYALRAEAAERRRGRLALRSRSSSRRAAARRVRAPRIAHA
jgi:hypothetical protein